MSEPKDKDRRRKLKREAKARLRKEGRSEDPLAQKARYKVLLGSIGEAFEKQVSKYTREGSPNLAGLLLADLSSAAFHYLREALEDPKDKLATWREPFLEIRYGVDFDPDKGEPIPLQEEPYPVSPQDLTDKAWRRIRSFVENGKAREDPIVQKLGDYLAGSVQASIGVELLAELTQGAALWLDGKEVTQLALYPYAPDIPEGSEEEVQAFWEDYCKPFVLAGPKHTVTFRFVGEWTPSPGRKWIPGPKKIPEPKPFACHPVLEIHPLVLDRSTEDAYYPVLVGLAFEDDIATLAAWNEEDRKSLLDSIEDAWVEITRDLQKDETSTTSATATILPKPEAKRPTPETRRRSVMSPIPLPRDVSKSSAGLALTKNLGRMFSGYNKVPDLDLRGETATAEAESLFWPVLEENLQAAVSKKLEAASLASWEKKEKAGQTTISLRGFQEPEARSLWDSTCKALNAGEGGPGLEVDPPGFEKRNRHEGGQTVIETCLIFWPTGSREGQDGESLAPARFRRESSPGYVALLSRHGPRPYFADGWLWIPRGGEREGFRLGGLQTLLFPEGRAALERIRKREKEDLSAELNRLHRNPSLFQSSDARAERDLQAAIERVNAHLEKLSVYEIGPDLMLSVYEFWYRQRDAWMGERVELEGGQVVDTRPWRIIRLDPNELRARLDPGRRWGANWRARLFEKLEALSTFERQTRTASGKKVDVGDRFLERVIDGRQGVAEGSAPEEDSGLGLTRILKRAGAIPSNAFFVQVSVDFMLRLVAVAVDEDGVAHWNLDAAKAAQDAALLVDPKDKRGAREKLEAKRREVQKKPWGTHSPRLLAVGNLEAWPQTRRFLAYTLLQETTPCFERYRDKNNVSRKRRTKNRLGGDHKLEQIEGRDYIACNGSSGFGYRVRVWMDKVEYQKRPGPGGGQDAFQAFLEDLRGLVGALDLQLKLEDTVRRSGRRNRLRWRKRGEEALEALETARHNPAAAYDWKLKLYLPADLEERLRERLDEAGIDAVDEDEGPETDRLQPVDLQIARRRAGLKQAELAERVGVARPLVSAWESGKKPIPPEREVRLREILSGHLGGGE